MSAVDRCCKYGATDATVDKWHSKYGGMDVSKTKRSTAVDVQNTKPKRLSGGANNGRFDAAREAQVWLLVPVSRRNAVSCRTEQARLFATPSQ